MATFKSISKKQAIKAYDTFVADDPSNTGLAIDNMARTLRDNGKFWVILDSDIPDNVLDEIIEEDFIGSPVYESEGAIFRFGLYSTDTDGPTSLSVILENNPSKNFILFTVGSNTYQVLSEKGLLA